MRRAGLGAALCLAAACGGSGEVQGQDGPPFGGREINFRSSYVYFPSSFGVTIVRDTLPQEEVCPLLKTYTKPPLPGKVEHYSLIITILSAMAGDDVTIDINDRGGAGDLRSVGLGLYPVGARAVPAGGFGVDAGGVVRLTALEQGARAAGSYNLKFRSGETLKGDFDISACPP